MRRPRESCAFLVGRRRGKARKAHPGESERERLGGACRPTRRVEDDPLSLSLFLSFKHTHARARFQTTRRKQSQTGVLSAFLSRVRSIGKVRKRDLVSAQALRLNVSLEIECVREREAEGRKDIGLARYASGMGNEVSSTVHHLHRPRRRKSWKSPTMGTVVLCHFPPPPASS